MKRSSFRAMLLNGVHDYHSSQHFNPCESVTDPTLAMSGTELAVASMLGQPIPQPAVNYSFNSATRPEMVSEIDSIKADPFEIYARQQQQKESNDQIANEIRNSVEYDNYINSKQQKQNEN